MKFSVRMVLYRYNRMVKKSWSEDEIVMFREGDVY